MPANTEHAVLVALLADLREKEVVQEVRSLLQRQISPLEILETCQVGMQRVGEQYHAGKYYISGLIMAGEIMRQVALLLEPVFKQERVTESLGLVLLGTIKGDIHDIGKNLFKALLECQGFLVEDLGVDVQPSVFLEAVQRIKPDVVAISSLLTVSYNELRETITLLKENMAESEIHAPVIIGGGMTDAKLCKFVNADHWGEDAMTGVQICKQIIAAVETHS